MQISSAAGTKLRGIRPQIIKVLIGWKRLLLVLIAGRALVTTKDVGDAVTLLQSLAGSTFDSSQLVLTACMGYQSINETTLQEPSYKHRPPVISAMEERVKGLGVWTDTNGLASKLFSFKCDPEPLVSLSDSAYQLSDVGDGDTNQESDPGNMDDEYGGVMVNSEIDLCLIQRTRSYVDAGSLTGGDCELVAPCSAVTDGCSHVVPLLAVWTGVPEDEGSRGSGAYGVRGGGQESALQWGRVARGAGPLEFAST